MRLLDAGWEILWSKSLSAYHYEEKQARPAGRKAYALARNHPLVALKNLPLQQVISNYVLWWGYAAWVAFKSRTPLAWLRGVGASLRAIPATREQRKVISKQTCELLKQRKGPYWY